MPDGTFERAANDLRATITLIASLKRCGETVTSKSLKKVMPALTTFVQK
jgi:hypothetical protein